MVPISANLVSHTSRVRAALSLSRPPACLSRALRWRSTRSSSSMLWPCLGCMAMSASSSQSRRSPGPPFTRIRSSGEKTLTRKTPSRSRALRSGCLLTSVRPRPVGEISASSNTSRRSTTASPRTMARSAPIRTMASLGAPRNDFSEAKYPKASSTLVFPTPLRPCTTVSPSDRVNSAVA